MEDATSLAEGFIPYVRQDQSEFANSKQSIATNRLPQKSIDTFLLELLEGDKNPDVNDCLAKMSDSYDVAASRRRIEAAAETEEIRKGTPAPRYVQEELLEEARSTAEEDGLDDLSESDLEDPLDEELTEDLIGPASEMEMECQAEKTTEKQCEITQSEMEPNEFVEDQAVEGCEPGPEPNSEIDADVTTDATVEDPSMPGVPTEASHPPVSAPRRVSAGVRVLRAQLARVQPGADHEAFRRLESQVEALSRKLDEIHGAVGSSAAVEGIVEKLEALQSAVGSSVKSVEALKPILAATAIKDNILPESEEMILRADRSHETGMKPEVKVPEPVDSRRRLPIGGLLFGLAAAFVIGIGIGAWTRGGAGPRGTRKGGEDARVALSAEGASKVQRVRLRYLRSEQAQLRIRIQVALEAQRLVDLRKAELEQAKASQAQNRIIEAQRAVDESERFLAEARTRAALAEKALAWVNSQMPS